MTTPANQPDLIAWLRDQLDDDEREILKHGPPLLPSWGVVPSRFTTMQAGTTVLMNPRRVLAEVDAKRRILDEHFEASLGDTGLGAGDCTTCTNYAWPCPTVRLLALPYADRPGYQERWRP